MRLTSVVWAIGAAAFIAWSDEPLLAPRENVCTPEIEPPYAECLTEEARRLAEEGGFTDELVARVQGTWGEIDPSRQVPRFRTDRYLAAARELAVRETWWALATWGAFLVLHWILSGFRTPE